MNLAYIRNLAHVLLITVAGICLAIAVFSFVQTRLFYKRAEHSTGKVVQVEEQRGHDGEIAHVSIFEFVDSSGKVHTVRDSVASQPASHKVGDAVVVLYETRSPSDARLESFASLWLGSVVMASLGALALVFSLLLFLCSTIYRRWAGKRATPAG